MANKIFSVLFDGEPMEFNPGRINNTSFSRSLADEQNHSAKLQQKREEKKKKEAEDSPNEKRAFVINGAELKCPYAPGKGKLVVTSNEINLQDKLWATEADGNIPREPVNTEASSVRISPNMFSVNTTSKNLGF